MTKCISHGNGQSPRRVLALGALQTGKVGGGGGGGVCSGLDRWVQYGVEAQVMINKKINKKKSPKEEPPSPPSLISLTVSAVDVKHHVYLL